MPLQPILDRGTLDLARLREIGGGFPIAVEEEAIDSYIARCGKLPPIVSSSSAVASPTTRSVDSAGVAYQVTEQRRELVADIVEHAFLQDIAAAGVWPGALIQGRPLLNGDVAPIPVDRAKGTISIVTELVGGPAPRSAEIARPSQATVDEALSNLLRALNPTDAAGLLKTDFQQAQTLREVGVKLGVTVKGAAFDVNANATLDQTYKSSTVVACIRQIFYSVTFAPSAAQSAGLLDPHVRTSELRRYAEQGNPPLYIASVQYGRLIIIAAQGAFSSSDIAAALKVHWTASVSGAVDLDVKTKEVLTNSTVKLYTLGVPGRANFKNLNDPVPELTEIYKDGLRFSLDNPGAAISFTARYLTDATLAHVGLTAQYVQPVSATAENVDQWFQVWDGPGGGLVDTGVLVAPGDDVTVNASGQTWSGVWATGTNGPEGWPGWKANAAAPLPEGTANAHIIRFGMGPWIEAGAFWSGQNTTGRSGVLQLNVNDNNPYNGDGNKRWSVHVRVVRRGAAAAGIFV